MALIKCSECGTEVSDKAAVCVKCGAPVKPTKASAPSGCAVIVLIVLGVSIAATVIGSISSGTEAKPAEESCQKDDLSCLGNKGVVTAGVYCQDAVEHLARHSVRWTDSTFGLRFSRFRWTDKPGGAITYIGDKAEFQNGFGAYDPVIYQCDLANDSKTVLDARVSEGRLPQ